MARKEKNKKEVKGFSSFLNNSNRFYIIDNNFAIAYLLGLIMVLISKCTISITKVW